jgi:hypothetical protein
MTAQRRFLVFRVDALAEFFCRKRTTTDRFMGLQCEVYFDLSNKRETPW